MAVTPSERDASEFECPYCARSFTREAYRDLHLGVDHEDRLTDQEQAAFTAARESEEQQLTLFRYKALGLLVVCYFLFLMAYALSL